MKCNVWNKHFSFYFIPLQIALESYHREYRVCIFSMIILILFPSTNCTRRLCMQNRRGYIWPSYISIGIQYTLHYVVSIQIFATGGELKYGGFKGRTYGITLIFGSALVVSRCWLGMLFSAPTPSGQHPLEAGAHSIILWDTYSFLSSTQNLLLLVSTRGE